MPDEAALQAWLSRCSVEIEVTLARGRRSLLRPRCVELLVEIDRTRSISAAARALGVSYRHAWLTVQEVNAAAGRELVEANVGGKRGGGAQLTDLGRAALRLFDRVRSSVRNATAEALPHALGLPVEAASSSIRLLAAVSLQDVAGELLAEYSLLRPQTRVRAVFGSSNELAEHVRDGLPADLFLSADAACLDVLEERGLIVPGTRRTFATNGLALVVDADATEVPATLRGWNRWSGGPIALADPASPLGSYTERWLSPGGVYEHFQGLRVSADNSRGVVSILRSGRARAGVVFTSEVPRLTNFRIAASCSAASVGVEYVAAVLARGEHREAALGVLEFFSGPRGRSLLRSAGFSPPDSERSTRRRKRDASATDTARPG